MPSKLTRISDKKNPISYLQQDLPFNNYHNMLSSPKIHLENNDKCIRLANLF